MPAPEVVFTVLTDHQFREGAYSCDADCETLAHADGEQPATARIAAVKVGRHVRKQKLTRITLSVPQSVTADTLSAFIRAWAEGIILGVYRMMTYKRDAEQELETLHVYVLAHNEEQAAAIRHILRVAQIYATCTNYARDLTNLPGNLLTPAILADEAERFSAQSGLQLEVLDELQIAALGMGGIQAVGQGSANPPRLITIRFTGDPSSTEVVGLVGKGITFDTGGISLKKPEGMEEMISDMGGAAVVLAVMRAVSSLKPKMNLVAVVAAAENMPSGSAYRPGDIITSLSGRTIEVLNTDAEGRIVLADAMSYAIRQGATKLIDVATLTGAVLVALADVATAAVTNDSRFLQQVIAASHEAEEKLWELPNYPEYRDKIKSDVADVKNSGGKWAGTITGALFIGEFAEGLPWIHLDTGGTAWLWEEKPLEPKGGTGAMVRTLLHYIERIAGQKGNK